MYNNSVVISYLAFRKLSFGLQMLFIHALHVQFENYIDLEVYDNYIYLHHKACILHKSSGKILRQRLFFFLTWRNSISNGSNGNGNCFQ